MNKIFLNENDEKYLQELVRLAYNIINPDKKHDLKWVVDRKNREILFKRFPWCFVSTKGTDIDNLTYPVCNRAGMIDPDIINISTRVAKNAISGGGSSHEIVLIKLNKLHDKFTKDVVRDNRIAYRKGAVTKNINTMNNYLDKIHNNREK